MLMACEPNLKYQDWLDVDWERVEGGPQQV